MRLTVLFAIVIFGHTEAAKPKSINVAIDTVFEFDQASDVEFIDQVQGILDKVKNLIRDNQKQSINESEKSSKAYGFTEFLVDVLLVLLDFEDDDLQELLQIVHKEIGENLGNDGLQQNVRRFLTNELDSLKMKPVKTIRRSLDKLLRNIQNGKNYKDNFLVRFINTLYNKNSNEKLVKFLQKLKIFRRSGKNTERLRRTVSRAVKSLILKHLLPEDKKKVERPNNLGKEWSKGSHYKQKSRSTVHNIQKSESVQQQSEETEKVKELFEKDERNFSSRREKLSELVLNSNQQSESSKEGIEISDLEFSTSKYTTDRERKITHKNGEGRHNPKSKTVSNKNHTVKRLTHITLYPENFDVKQYSRSGEGKKNEDLSKVGALRRKNMENIKTVNYDLKDADSFDFANLTTKKSSASDQYLRSLFKSKRYRTPYHNETEYKNDKIDIIPKRMIKKINIQSGNKLGSWRKTTKVNITGKSNRKKKDNRLTKEEKRDNTLKTIAMKTPTRGNTEITTENYPIYEANNNREEQPNISNETSFKMPSNSLNEISDLNTKISHDLESKTNIIHQDIYRTPSTYTKTKILTLTIHNKDKERTHLNEMMSTRTRYNKTIQNTNTKAINGSLKLHKVTKSDDINKIISNTFTNPRRKIIQNNTKIQNDLKTNDRNDSYPYELNVNAKIYNKIHKYNTLKDVTDRVIQNYSKIVNDRNLNDSKSYTISPISNHSKTNDSRRQRNMNPKLNKQENTGLTDSNSTNMDLTPFDIRKYMKNLEVNDVMDVGKKKKMEQQMKADLESFLTLPETVATTTAAYTDIFEAIDDAFGMDALE